MATSWPQFAGFPGHPPISLVTFWSSQAEESCGSARLERGLPQEGTGLEAGKSAGLGRP